MTARVFDELKVLWEQSTRDGDTLVFGIKDNFQNGFTKVITEAGIQDLRFHDLRHTAITRMVNAGLPAMEIMKVSGHTQWTTFARYVNPNSEAVNRIADALSSYTSRASAEVVSDLVN
jgi:integrase